jgi:riboflavin biosynthesis pyrimidine reductase
MDGTRATSATAVVIRTTTTDSSNRQSPGAGCAVLNSTSGASPLTFLRVTDRAELSQLRLRAERAVLAQRHLQSLVVEAGATLAALRRDIRAIKARVARAVRPTRRSTSKERPS